jgi:hypothetical protein
MPSPVVVITGASQGIGAAIAREFAREVRGVRLALLARNEKNLRRVSDQRQLPPVSGQMLAGPSGEEAPRIIHIGKRLMENCVRERPKSGVPGSINYCLSDTIFTNKTPWLLDRNPLKNP